MKKVLTVTAMALILCVLLSACNNGKDNMRWKTNPHFDLSAPNFDGSGIGETGANEAGWYEVFTDNFDGDKLNYGLENYNLTNNEVWTTSPHALRWHTAIPNKETNNSYWCPDMVKVENGQCIITSIETTNHTCSGGVCPTTGRFSGGIETRRVVNPEENKGTADELLFSQAFGYFETRVKLPKTPGLWSAFWLQSSNMRKVGNEGLDGTEIDIYESAFLGKNKDGKSSKMGHALLWDGYSSNGKGAGYVDGVDVDLYEGFHTFALKWTPLYYVFYIDGVATWASMNGGVSKVKEFLRLTVEMDGGDGGGPHGMKIGQYKNENSKPFIIDYVKVYQNKNYLKYEIEDNKFDGVFDLEN